jgi:hypothetical protein
MKNPTGNHLHCGVARAAGVRADRGFALVISLSLMVLLTVLAVGLLSLSTISLRASSQGDAMAVAKANARMSLSLAIGELQKLSGPDQRITMAADQLNAGDGKESAAAAEKRHWTGVYRSWVSGTTDRPTPEFLSWLVSSPDRTAREVDTAKSAPSAGDSIELVGKGTLGVDGDGNVKVPLVSSDKQGGLGGRFAWWVGDQGVKAALAAPKTEASESPALVRQTLQGSPRNAVEMVSTAAGQKPFQDLQADTAGFDKITGWRQSEHLAASPAGPRPLFHDLAPFSTGLLTNVRSGGFRKDLSMHLERDLRRAPKESLYKVSGQDGINMAELWLHYNMWKELKSRGRFSYTTGGSLSSSASYLQVEGTMAAMTTDPEHFYKQPAIVAYHTAVSFTVRPNNRLALVIDPIVTYWNPLDVPVVLTPAYNSIKFWQLPYDLKLTVGSKSVTTTMRNALAGSAYHYLTLIAGKAQPIVMRPGEVMMVSQGPGTDIQPYESASLRYLEGKAGWNYGGGISVDLRDSSGNYVVMNSTETLRYTITPNGQISDGTRHWSLNHHETYYKEDRAERGESVGIGGVYIDSIYGLPHNESNPKPASSRLSASNYPNVFDKVKPADTRPLTGSQLAGRKEPVMMFSYVAKTEQGSTRGGRYFQRFNPKAMNVDFYNLSEAEFDMLPFEIQIQPLNSWKNRNLEVSTTGNGYYGGGMNAEFGSNYVTTHSVPREPLYSLGALQHAFANGFSSLNPPTGYAVVNARYPMLPQVSHPIGNATAPAVIPANRTQGTLAGGPRVLADHSYLANNALWDDWFFSGIAPQTTANFPKSRNQATVAKDFFNATSSLPVVRYLPDTRGKKVDDLVSSMFSGSTPSTEATTLIASLLRVDGMFNVNSTSVEAWKALLGGLKKRPVMTRTRDGIESLTAAKEETPVTNLFAPQDEITDGDNSVDVKTTSQWVGRRTLSDEEIDQLAEAIVRQVRKRGPFLSLADFVNRRVGNDKDLARAGAIQSALEDKDVSINRAWNEGDRSVPTTASGRMTFPEAEKGPAANGIPGIVKQADLLTPIAPLLSARSDSFVIRSYGDAVDADGKVIARAWCEAVVERDKEFIDSLEKPETATANLKSDANKTFGRRYKVQSFRWLNPAEV